MGVALPQGNVHSTPSGAAGMLAGFISGLMRQVAVAFLSLALVFSAWPIRSAQAAGETRSLKIYFVHTGERANITFKRNGRYDEKGLQALNRLLRDWRRNESRRMDPRLFDLAWEIYQDLGTNEYMYVVSGYRAPATNNMLRTRSAGVAKNSQHTFGRAMDFYIPGVDLRRIRNTALKQQSGGVGFYPNSGSPFVHIDVASVRAWPRLSRQELVRLFPNGKTMHIPADGVPLPGYELAVAEYKRRVSSGNFAVADAGGARPKKRNFLTALFGGGGDEDEDADSIVAPPAAPPRPTVADVVPAKPKLPPTTAPAEIRNLPGSEALVAAAPVPAQRPAFAGQVPGNGLATALYSPPRNTAEEALAAVLPAERPQAQDKASAYPDLAQMAIPVPTLLGKRNATNTEDAVLTASAAPINPDLTAIPVPAARPAVAEALLAQNDGGEEAEEDAAEQNVLSSDMIAALNTTGADARRAHEAANQSMMEQAASATVAAPADEELASVPVPMAAPATARANTQKPAEVASLEKQPAQFGDVFDAPKPVARGIEAGLPEKGGRPAQAEAEKARRAMTSGASELTGDTLAKWAFARQRQPSTGGSLKAQRLSTQAIVADAEQYGENNRPQQLQADTDRFSGSSRVLTVNIP